MIEEKTNFEEKLARKERQVEMAHEEMKALEKLNISLSEEKSIQGSKISKLEDYIKELESQLNHEVSNYEEVDV